jgi:predicted phage terminase large subunit-like protein
LGLVVSKSSLEAGLCRDSFFDFFLRFWDQIIPEKLVLNWHIKYLCDELQQVAERVFLRKPKEYDLIINVAPGSTKSTICSVMFPAWCWTRDPTLRLICGSYAFPLSLYLASQSWHLVMGDKYRQLFNVELVQESKGLLQPKQGGQRIATSTGGSITGMHGHLIVIDDPINPKEAVSDVALRSANEWFDHTLMTRTIDKAITPVILIMQRLHENDPTAHLLERKSITPIKHICLPAEVSSEVRPRSMRSHYVDGLFDPVRLPRKILDKTRAELGDYAYAGQFGQRPIPKGGGMFRVDQIKIIHSATSQRMIVRYWDKAGSAGKGAWTVGTKMGLGADRSFTILDVKRGQWEASQRERIIRQTAEMDGKGVIVALEQEPGSGGKESAYATLKNLAGWHVRIDRPVGDKALRADPFAVQVNGGNVQMVRAEWNGPYLAELAFFPFSKFKDQVDSSSGAFAVLTGKRWRIGAL